MTASMLPSTPYPTQQMASTEIRLIRMMRSYISGNTGAVNITFSARMVIVSTEKKTARRADQLCAPSGTRMLLRRSREAMDLSSRTIRPTLVSLSASLSVSNSVTETMRTSCQFRVEDCTNVIHLAAESLDYMPFDTAGCLSSNARHCTVHVGWLVAQAPCPCTQCADSHPPMPNNVRLLSHPQWLLSQTATMW